MRCEDYSTAPTLMGAQFGRFSKDLKPLGSLDQYMTTDQLLKDVLDQEGGEQFGSIFENHIAEEINQPSEIMNHDFSYFEPAKPQNPHQSSEQTEQIYNRMHELIGGQSDVPFSSLAERAADQKANKKLAATELLMDSLILCQAGKMHMSQEASTASNQKMPDATNYVPLIINLI